MTHPPNACHEAHTSGYFSGPPFWPALEEGIGHPGQARCRFQKALILCALFFFLVAHQAWAWKREFQDSDPIVRAILYIADNARAWVDYKGFRYHIAKGMHLNPDWTVEDIRRESVLFRRKSDRSFLEAPLEVGRKARWHRDWSFWGEPLGLWESLEILAAGFKFHLVMHCQAGGAVVPRCHGNSLEQMMIRTIPPNHRYAFVGPILLVFPVHPGDEDWKKILERMKECTAESLCLRYPGLRKPGSLFSRGDDIQQVLRQISLGSGEKIAFYRDLHFPVYAMFKSVPFSVMLQKIVYLNQCFIIERDSCLEIQSWPHPLRPMPLPPVPEMVIAGPEEPQQGEGPTPPSFQPPDIPTGKQRPPIWSEARRPFGNLASPYKIPPLPQQSVPMDSE